MIVNGEEKVIKLGAERKPKVEIKEDKQTYSVPSSIDTLGI